MSEPGPQQQKSARTRARLLDAASVVVRRDGVQAMTVARVATEAGMSKGGLLHHFGSKDELVSALLEATLADADVGLAALTESFRATRADEGSRSDAPDQGGDFARAYLEYVRRPDEHHADSATAVFAAAAAGDGDLGPAAKIFEAWQQRLMHDDGLDPALGLLARVVGDGLWLIDLFGLARPAEADRAAVLDLVAKLIDAELE